MVVRLKCYSHEDTNNVNDLKFDVKILVINNALERFQEQKVRENIGLGALLVEKECLALNEEH